MIYLTSTALTRPADTLVYASGDLIANSTTAGSVVLPVIDTPNNAFAFRLDRVLLRKSGTSVTTCTIRVHLFTAQPATVTNGDNGAFLLSGSSTYLGYTDTTVDVSFTDGAAGYSSFIQHDIILPSRSGRLWVALEARSAYTPASAEVFTVTLMCTDSL